MGKFSKHRFYMMKVVMYTRHHFLLLSLFLLGTDMKGYDLLHRVVDGAKWTIGISLLIAFLRTFIGLAIGLFFAFYVRKSFKTLEALFDCFTVVPMTLIGYFILDTVLRFQNGSPAPSFFERASFEIVVLVILALPFLYFILQKRQKDTERRIYRSCYNIRRKQISSRYKTHISKYISYSNHCHDATICTNFNHFLSFWYFRIIFWWYNSFLRK